MKTKVIILLLLFFGLLWASDSKSTGLAAHEACNDFVITDKSRSDMDQFYMQSDQSRNATQQQQVYQVPAQTVRILSSERRKTDYLKNLELSVFLNSNTDQNSHYFLPTLHQFELAKEFYILLLRHLII